MKLFRDNVYNWEEKVGYPNDDHWIWGVSIEDSLDKSPYIWNGYNSKRLLSMNWRKLDLRNTFSFYYFSITIDI